MSPKPRQEFSDSEVEDILSVAEEEFGLDDDWKVNSVQRPSERRDAVDLEIEHRLDGRRLTIPMTCQEFPGGESPNGSQLTDAVFDISIRLMEFHGIRGFDEFEDGETVPLEIYPESQLEPEDIPPGVQRNV